MNIGERIQELREARGMPKAELARRARTTRNTLYRIEAGKTRPSAAMVEQLARGLDLEPGELFKNAPSPGTVVSSGKAEAPPTGPAQLAPGAPEPLSLRVREWLQEHDAIFGAMTDEEFENHVLAMDLELDSEGKPVAIERLIDELDREDVDIHQALSRESRLGGTLFPKVERGPNFGKRVSERWREIRRLQEKLHRKYGAWQLGLINYSARLYDGRIDDARLYDKRKTGDYLAPARMAEGERRRLLQESFVGADTA